MRLPDSLLDLVAGFADRGSLAALCGAAPALRARHRDALWRRVLVERHARRGVVDVHEVLGDTGAPPGFFAFALRLSLAQADLHERVRRLEAQLKRALAPDKPPCACRHCALQQADAPRGVRALLLLKHWAESAAHAGRLEALRSVEPLARARGALVAPATAAAAAAAGPAPGGGERPLLAHALANACLAGFLPVVRLLHEEWGVPLTAGCWMAAEYDRRPVALYLHARRCPWDDNSLAQAACYGHLPMVLWLMRRGYARSQDACNDAIRRTEHAPMRAALRLWRALLGVAALLDASRARSRHSYAVQDPLG